MTRISGEHLWHTETLDSCFNLIRSHQQDTPCSLPLEIEPATTEPKLYHWPISLPLTQVMPNQLGMVTARSINLNVSCKLHLHSWQRTRSPPGSLIPRRIGNTHPRNYYNLKGKGIDVFAGFSGLGKSIHYDFFSILKKETWPVLSLVSMDIKN